MDQDLMLKHMRSALPFLVRNLDSGEEVGLWVADNILHTCYPDLQTQDWDALFDVNDIGDYELISKNLAYHYDLIDYFDGEPIQPKKCICDFYDVILTTGCQCGGQ